MEYTAAEIAKKMDISARTVEAIKDRLMERFGREKFCRTGFLCHEESADRMTIDARRIVNHHRACARRHLNLPKLP